MIGGRRKLFGRESKSKKGLRGRIIIVALSRCSDMSRGTVDQRKTDLKSSLMS
jgi:hypothetical protein